jgi:subtilisin family serine protease
MISFRHGLQYYVSSRSLTEPADSSNAITAGAVAWNSPNTIAYYSSQGPTMDSRIKPDIVAPSSVSNPTYGTFAGTSASAPHVSGAAALVKQQNPSFTPVAIQAFLESSAVSLGTPGKDNIYGSGRLYLSTLFPPSDLIATAVSYNQINLSWTDNANDELGFKIERKTGAGAFAQIAQVAANVTTYNNIALTAGTEYTYRVRAYNAAAASGYSNEAAETTFPPPPPAPTPLLPASGAVSPTLTPTLDWSDPAGAVAYSVQVSTISTFATPIVNEIGRAHV